MKTIFLYLLMSMLVPATMYAQSLQESAKKIEGLMESVQTKAGNIEQRFALDGNRTFVAEYVRTTTDTKGRVEEQQYRFSLADVDHHTVRTKAERELMMVVMNISGREKSVRVTEREGKKSYRDEIEIACTNADNANALVVAIKEIIPAAKENAENHLQIPADVNGQSKQLASFIKEVPGATQYVTFEIGDGVQSTLVQNEQGKESTYIFNMAHLDPNGLEIRAAGSEVQLRVGTRGKRAYILRSNKGDLAYVRDLTVRFDDFEEARDCRTVLKKLVETSREKWESNLPQPTSLNQAFELFTKLVPKTAGNESQQNVEITCLSSVQLSTQEAKGMEHVESRFNWGDIALAEVETKGDRALLVLSAANRARLIYVTKNGEQQAFGANVELVATDPSNAEILSHLSEYILKECRNDFESQKRAVSLSELPKMIASSTEESTEVKQSWEETESCLIQLKTNLISSKSSKETLYEFNMKYLDPNRVELRVKGKEVHVTAVTKNVEKVIKTYQDGEPRNYVSEIHIITYDLELARKIKWGMEMAMEQCK